MNPARSVESAPHSGAKAHRIAKGAATGVCALLALCLAAGAAAGAGSARIALLRIDLAEQSAGMRGDAIGRATLDTFSGLERRWDTYLHQAFAAAGGDPQARFDRLLAARIAPLRAHGLDDEDRAEVDGLAASWSLVGGNRLGDGSLSYDELWAAQLLADLGLTGGGVGFAVFADASADGGTLVGRNRDALVADAVEPPRVITVRNDGRRRRALIGFAGQVAPATGLNDDGLFLAHLPVAQSSRGAPTAAVGFALSGVLARETQVGPAAGALARQRFSAGQALLIADPARAAVLEQAAGARGALRTDTSPALAELAWNREGQVAVVDCLVLPRWRGNCRQLRDRYRWQRLRSLARFGGDGPRARLDDVAAILLDTGGSPYPLRAPGTREVLLYQPQEQALYLRTFPPGTPAAAPSTHARPSAATLPLYRPFQIGADAAGQPRLRRNSC